MAAGTEARVAISDSVVLDLAGLFGSDTGEKQAPEKPVEQRNASGEYKTIADTEKPVKRLVEGVESQQAKQLHLEAVREREERERTLEIYREYQRNTMTSSQLQTEILKGARAGEDIYSLFLKAVKAISLMTSNSLFYTQLEGDIRAIYGRGLQEAPAIDIELEQVVQRYIKLLEALEREQDGDSKDRIKRAIAAHENRIKELEALKEKQGKAS